jgi:DNA-binding XRE family transcriptional regulator
MASGWPTRKSVLSAEDRTVSVAVKGLRLSLGMTQKIFGRQIGVDEKTVGRWERHNFCPRRNFLVRLKQLEDLNRSLDDEQKAAMEWVGTHEEPKIRALRGKERKKVLEAALAVMILRQGSRPADTAILTTEEVQGQFGMIVLVRESKKKGTYTFRVRISNYSKWPRKATKATIEGRQGAE